MCYKNVYMARTLKTPFKKMDIKFLNSNFSFDNALNDPKFLSDNLWNAFEGSVSQIRI